jgi:hypothetical protein
MAIWFAETPRLEDISASHTGLLAPHLGIRFIEIGDD